MILTPLNIQVAIIKAFYALAKKSVKYYTGLALGKNNTCLFKEIRLLRAYVDILRNFEIVGSTDSCHCCIQGNYTFLEGETTFGPIQFLCDGTGYLLSDSFIYQYDSANNNLIWDLDGDITTFTNITFTSDCSFSGYSDETLYTFTTDNPCVSTTIEQTCLNNNQVIKIIEHVNKLVR
jgi:hypothetical protein